MSSPDPEKAHRAPEGDKVERGSEHSAPTAEDDLDLLTLHERHAGRLVIDPEEAKKEFGPAFASRLKLSKDGTKVLYPQPTDSPEDPQNWSDYKKHLLLLIITMAAFVPDFDSGIGIAAIFQLAVQYNTTPGNINNLTSNWSIFLLGWGGIFAVIVVRRYGRLPVLFWSQVIALGFLLGCTVAPNLKTFAGMRCLTAFFATAPQVTGLYIVADLFPFHLQARKLNIWTMGFLVSPFISPFLLGYLVGRTTWRWAYGIGCIYSAIVVFMITFFMEETMYDRSLKPIPPRPTTGLRYRIETLVGITGLKMAKYRTTWTQAIMSPLNLVWRPHLLPLLVYEGVIFGFSIGINVTNVVFVGTPPPVGYGFSPNVIASLYATPVVAVVLGELIGRYLNDYIAEAGIRRNHGVFEAEVRLWTTYLALALFICGFLVLGASFQKHLTVGALIMGWGISELSVMINTVAIYAYCNDAFPKNSGEISALINLARVLGGFSVAYFQVPWATKNGALQTFGCEASIVAGLFILIIPAMQLKGRYLRERFSF